jgi:hypothetical protein
VEATVDRIFYPFRWAAFSTVPNTIVGGERTDKELWLRSTTLSPTSIDSYDSSLGPYDASTNRGSQGDIGANGDVTIESAATVNGSVRGGDGVFRTGATVSGTVSSGLSPDTNPWRSFPSVPPPSAPAPGFALTAGTYRLSGTYVYSWLSVADGTTVTADGPLTIYVTGGLTIGNGVTIGSPGDPNTRIRIILKSEGTTWDTATATIRNDFTLYGALYGKNADVSIGDRARVYGSLAARTLSIGPGSGLHYDRALGSQELCHSSSSENYSIRRGTWREVLP